MKPAIAVFLIALAVFLYVLHELSRPYTWRPVRFDDGSYGVAACYEDDTCATSGAGMTGYRFDNIDDARREAFKLETVHARQHSRVVPVR